MVATPRGTQIYQQPMMVMQQQPPSTGNGAISTRKSVRGGAGGIERYGAGATGASQGKTSYSKQRAQKNQPPLMISKEAN